MVFPTTIALPDRPGEPRRHPDDGCCTTELKPCSAEGSSVGGHRGRGGFAGAASGYLRDVRVWVRRGMYGSCEIWFSLIAFL
ncbi:hypothetical protein E2C01_095231 [Portunus trituberculatus]|uniref:Uncharacterized protein n=1 Tax=Portunus trituberculatus TaxID=210409 RepID=A0A5B7JZN1_PORTR|nr:hypothetical protein [Portunus trituberculatus]